MLGELLCHFETEAEKSAINGDAYTQQRNKDAARAVKELIFLQQQDAAGKKIDEDTYWKLRDKIYGSPDRSSLLEEIAGT